MHRFKIYSGYHKRTLSMLQTTLEPCLIFCQIGKELVRLISIQADDFICTGNSSSPIGEEKRLIEFRKKESSNIGIEMSQLNSVK